MSTGQRVFVLVLAAVAMAVTGWRFLAWRAAADEFEVARNFHSEVTTKTARLSALRAVFTLGISNMRRSWPGRAGRSSERSMPSTWQ